MIVPPSIVLIVPPSLALVLVLIRIGVTPILTLLLILVKS